MHLLALTSILTVIFAVTLYYADPYSHQSDTSITGNALLYGALYLAAVVIGVVGWLVSIGALLKIGRPKTKHAVFAALYVVIGVIGFCWAYYLTQT